MDLELILKPQDKRADTVANLALARSFVTYNPATLQRILDFFRTERVSTSPPKPNQRSLPTPGTSPLAHNSLCIGVRLILLCLHQMGIEGEMLQAVDFSALSAQAAARVEQARQAAQQQLAAAFKQKPKLAMRLFLEAPTIAIPCPATFDSQSKPQSLFSQEPLLISTPNTLLDHCSVFRPEVVPCTCLQSMAGMNWSKSNRHERLACAKQRR